jgi:hypothetical protein
MTGSGLFDFLIVIVALIIIGAIIFAALEFIVTDERFKKIARLAIGGVIVLLLLYAIKGVLFGGGSGLAITPAGLITFAIGVIVLLVVWFLIVWALDWAGRMFPPLESFKEAIKFVVSAVMLIVLLLLAANLLFGASMGVGGYSPFRGERHGALLGNEWASARLVPGLPAQPSIPSAAAVT